MAQEKDDIDDFFDDLLAEPLFDEPAKFIPAAAATQAPAPADHGNLLDITTPAPATASAVSAAPASAGDSLLDFEESATDAQGIATTTSVVEATVFSLDDEDASPVAASPNATSTTMLQTAAVTSSTSPAAGDWYDMDAQDAERQLTESSGARAQADSGEKASSKLGSWASAFKKKAASQLKETKTLAAYAKKAVAEELSIVHAEAKDLAKGVKEGVALTADDSVGFRERVARDAKAVAAKNKGWGGILGLGGGAGAATSEAEQKIDAGSASAAASTTATSTATSGDESSVAPVASSDTKPVSSVEDFPDLIGTAPASGDPLIDAITAGSPVVTADKAQEPTKSRKDKALENIRQGLAVTKEVSKDMWKDLVEVNQEVGKDIKQNFADVKSVLKATSAVVKDGVSSRTPGAIDDNTSASSSGAAANDDSLDAMLASEGSDDQSSQVADERMKEVAMAMKQGAGELWRDLHAGIRDAMARVPGVDRNAEDANGDGTTWLLPSTRANYVVLVGQDLPCCETVGGSASSTAGAGAGAGGLDATAAAQKAAFDATTAALDDAGAAVSRQAEFAAAAAEKFRKKIAKRSKDVHAAVLKQARDIGQKIEAGASGAAKPSGGTNPDGGDVPDAGEGIFEIGSDSDEMDGEESDGEPAFDDLVGLESQPPPFQPPPRSSQIQQPSNPADVGGLDSLLDR